MNQRVQEDILHKLLLLLWKKFLNSSKYNNLQYYLKATTNILKRSTRLTLIEEIQGTWMHSLDWLYTLLQVWNSNDKESLYIIYTYRHPNITKALQIITPLKPNPKCEQYVDCVSFMILQYTWRPWCTLKFRLSIKTWITSFLQSMTKKMAAMSCYAQ